MEEYFKKFKFQAFRLECLPEYNIPEEKDDYRRFLQSGQIDPKGNSDWYKIIKEAKDRQASFFRVRVVDFPLSDYLRFEFAYYRLNLVAGENIFIISQKDFNNLSPRINFDYWLFDDEAVFKMNYDLSGQYLGFEKNPAGLASFIEFKNNLLKQAMPFKL